MTKIVYNTCYGGYGLSHEAIVRYAEIKGIKLYSEPGPFAMMSYHTTPPDQRAEDGSDYFSYYDIDRADPALVQVVEELGPAANGDFAALMIADILPGTLYRIDEYDGMESVMTVDDYAWRTA